MLENENNGTALPDWSLAVWYVDHERYGGVLVAARTRSDAVAAVNFGGVAGKRTCRLARAGDRSWSYGATTASERLCDDPPTLTMEYARKRFHVPDDVPVLASLQELLHPLSAIRGSKAPKTC